MKPKKTQQCSIFLRRAFNIIRDEWSGKGMNNGGCKMEAQERKSNDESIENMVSLYLKIYSVLLVLLFMIT